MASAPAKKSEPVIIMGTVIVFMQVVSAGLGALGIIPPAYVSGVALFVAAATAALAYYTRSVVTPMQDVAAYVDSNGKTVAGPAAPLVMNDPATVVPAPDGY